MKPRQFLIPAALTCLAVVPLLPAARLRILHARVPPACTCNNQADAAHSITGQTCYICPDGNVGISIVYQNPTYVDGECTTSCELPTKECNLDFPSNIMVQIGNCVSSAWVKQAKYNVGSCHGITVPTEYDIDTSCSCQKRTGGADQSCFALIQVFKTQTNCTTAGTSPDAQLKIAFICKKCAD